MNPELLLTFGLSVAIIVAVPGPNIILIINDSIQYGFRTSILTMLGIKAGTSLLVALSLSGLAVMLSLFSSLFVMIKWAGVCYLVYLGLSQFMASLKKSHPHPDMRANNSGNCFMKGFIVSATNPKGMLFAGAFFPQFLDPQTAIGPQIVILVVCFLVVSFLIEVLYAYAGDTTGRLFATDGFKNITQRISGVLLIVLGLGLAFVKTDR